MDGAVSVETCRTVLTFCWPCISIYLSHLSQPVHETAIYRCDDTRGCVMQFWPPDDEHMCSKHVEAWNKLIVKQKFCASSWLITEINKCRTVSTVTHVLYRLCALRWYIKDIISVAQSFWDWFDLVRFKSSPAKGPTNCFVFYLSFAVSGLQSCCQFMIISTLKAK